MHERSVNIDLRPYTTVKADLFPYYDPNAQLEPIDNTGFPHVGRVQQKGAFVEKKAVRGGHDTYLEAIAAVLINHIAARKRYYFAENALVVNSISYSISLVPEIPYELRGDTVVYVKLPGKNSHAESWEKMVPWDQINSRPDQKMVITDLKMHARLLRKVEAMHERLLRDTRNIGIEIDDHWLGQKQELIWVNEGLRHIFVGIVDFEQITPETQLRLEEHIAATSNFAEVIESFLKRNRRGRPLT